MTDPRYTKLARLLVEYSIRLKKGDRVLMEVTDVPDEFAVELMRAARRAGALPVIEVRHSRVTREVVLDTNPRHAALIRDIELRRMKKMQAYIAIRGSANINETSDVPGERMALYSRAQRPVRRESAPSGTRRWLGGRSRPRLWRGWLGPHAPLRTHL